MSQLRIDLHVHTIYSKDSLIMPKDSIKQARNKNLNGIAICDHDTLKGWKMLKNESQKDDFYLIPGMEIKTDLGEILALFLENDTIVKLNNFFEITDAIRQEDGLIVIPHPFDFLRFNRLKINQIDEQSLKNSIDGIEIMNSRIVFQNCINKAKNFNKHFKFFETGGSDAHTLNEIGNGFTIINYDEPINSLEDIRKALISKRSKAGGCLSSPLVHVKTILHKLWKGLYF
ncbi:MAG: PHP-associated domain-containing protein [Promethearchaeota archaeon]